MEIWTHTPLLYSRKGFPRKDGKPFLPGNEITQALSSAIVYYYIRKDKDIERQIKRLLLQGTQNIDNIIEKIKSVVFEKYFNPPYIPDIPLTDGKLFYAYVDIFDTKKWDVIDYFKIEAFSGILHVPFDTTEIKRIKPAALSFATALLKMEIKLLEDYPVVENFHVPLLNEIKNWSIPLRIGYWTENKYEKNLLYFWRIKDVRESLLREYKIDIIPHRFLILPREQATPGWSEIKI